MKANLACAVCATLVAGCASLRHEGDPCRADENCPFDLVCCQGICREECDPAATGAACREDDDCLDGHRCVDDVCLKSSGATCFESVECSSSLCVDSVCCDIADGSVCTWWECGWSRRRRLFFDTLAVSETLVDFPVLVRLDSNVIDYSRTDGADLRFFDQDGSGPLSHEVEKWQEDGTSFVWVRVPAIDPGPSTDSIWMYYGSARATPWQNPHDVWDAHFRAVWHLSESTQALDSTANACDGTPTAGANPVAEGQIGDGLRFDDASDGVVVPSSPCLDITTGITLEAWVRPDAIELENRYAISKDATYRLDVMRGYDTTPTFMVYIADKGDWYGRHAGEDVTADGWSHLAGTYGAGEHTLRTYIDGVEKANRTIGDVLASYDIRVYGSDLEIGRHFVGLLDEVRVSDVERSPAWLAAQVASMTGALVTFDEEEALCGLE